MAPGNSVDTEFSSEGYRILASCPGNATVREAKKAGPGDMKTTRSVLDPLTSECAPHEAPLGKDLSFPWEYQVQVPAELPRERKGRTEVSHASAFPAECVSRLFLASPSVTGIMSPACSPSLL